MSYSMCSGPKKREVVIEDDSSFHENILEAWAGAECMIIKDLPRLAKRTTIYVSGVPVFNGSEQGQCWSAVVAVIELLMEQFDPDKHADNTDFFAAQKLLDPNENILATESLLKELNPGDEVRAILRACAQTLVYQPSYEIIKRLFDEEPLKDVRTVDGWNVDIRILDETVQVVHRKKQQKCVREDDPDHLTVQWELIMTFERDMVRMTSATLQLVNLNLHENMEKQKVNHYNAKLCGGNLRVL